MAILCCNWWIMALFSLYHNCFNQIGFTLIKSWFSTPFVISQPFLPFCSSIFIALHFQHFNFSNHKAKFFNNKWQFSFVNAETWLCFHRITAVLIKSALNESNRLIIHHTIFNFTCIFSPVFFDSLAILSPPFLSFFFIPSLIEYWQK